MIKWTEFSTYDSEGTPLISRISDVFEKTAEYRSDLQEFLTNLKRKSGMTYILVNAMTSGEHFGPNLNGDFFPEEQLKKYHKTFENGAYAYRHHQNKDPKNSAGKVVFSTYHPDMKRVELVIELEDKKAEDILDRLKRNELPAVSMGTRTPSDKCSVCDHRSKNVGEYCDHLKYQMRHTMSDGRRVFAVNDDRLTFFDISFVRIPADKTASVITKIASTDTITIPSAQVGEDWLKASGIKESALFKDVPALIEGASPDPRNLIYDSTPRIPKEKLDKIAESFPLNQILSSLLVTRIAPKLEDFVRLVLIASRKPSWKELAEKYYRHEHQLVDLGEDPLIPVDVTYTDFNEDLIERLTPLMADHALSKPLIIRRVMIKRADALLPTNENQQLTGSELQSNPNSAFGRLNPTIPLLGLGALWYFFNKKFHNPDMGPLQTFMMAHPAVGAAILGSIGIGANQLIKTSGFRSNLLPATLVGIPVSYLAAGHAENKKQRGEELGLFNEIVNKHPFMTGMVGAVAGAAGVTKFNSSSLVQKTLKKFSSYDRIISGLSPAKFDELYNDAIDNNR
jgi:hypothetical protein